MRFPLGGVEAEGRVAEPGQGRFGHACLLGLGRREPNAEGPSDAAANLMAVGSRLLPLVLATAALAAGAAGLGGLALWLGLLAVPAAAAAAFVGGQRHARGTACAAACRDERRGARCSSSWPRRRGRTPRPDVRRPRSRPGALVLALLAYGVPLVAWVLEPMRVPQRTRPQRRLRPRRGRRAPLPRRLSAGHPAELGRVPPVRYPPSECPKRKRDHAAGGTPPVTRVRPGFVTRTNTARSRCVSARGEPRSRRFSQRDGAGRAGRAPAATANWLYGTAAAEDARAPHGASTARGDRDGEAGATASTASQPA